MPDTRVVAVHVVARPREDERRGAVEMLHPGLDHDVARLRVVDAAVDLHVHAADAVDDAAQPIEIDLGVMRDVDAAQL